MTCSTDAFALAGSSLALVALVFRLLAAGCWLPRCWLGEHQFPQRSAQPDQGWSCVTPSYLVLLGAGGLAVPRKALDSNRCRVVSQPSCSPVHG